MAGTSASGRPSENSHGRRDEGWRMSSVVGMRMRRKARSISPRALAMAGTMMAMRAVGFSRRRSRAQLAAAAISSR
jgi:hypothetical protein